MIRFAPAASLRSSRDHSLSGSAAVGSRAQAMVKPARCPIDRPAASSPLLRRRMISISPIASTSQTAVAAGRSATRGGSPVRARMLRMPRAWAPSSSASRAIRLRSRVVRWTRHSRSSCCWMPKATAMAPIRTRPVAESLMLTSVDAGLLQQAGGLDGPVDADRARRVDLDARSTNEPSASLRARPDGGVASAPPDVSARGVRGAAPPRVRLAGRQPRRPSGRVASRAGPPAERADGRASWRRARLSGAGRRSPPASPWCARASCRSSRRRCVAPAASICGTISPKYSGPAA